MPLRDPVHPTRSCHSETRFSRGERAVLITLAVLLAAAGLHGATLGLSAHGDSRAIVERSIPAILRGSYLPGRSFGNPLYEYVCGAIYRVTGSLLAVNCYSIVMGIGSLVLFGRLLRDGAGALRRSLALAGFALNPLVLINTSALIEWMQATLLLLVLLMSAELWLGRRRHQDLVAYAFCSALLVLTRPDAVWVCAAILLALIWSAQGEAVALKALLFANVIAAVGTAAIFLIINHGTGFLNGYEPSGDGLLRRSGIALLSVAAAFGPLGGCFLVCIDLALVHRMFVDGSGAISWWGRLLLVTSALFTIRMILLPDKLEYLLPLLVIALLTVTIERFPTYWVACVATSSLLSSFVCVSLFARHTGQDQMRVDLAITPGAVAQEWEVTSYYNTLQKRQFLQGLARVVYPEDSHQRPVLQAVNYAIGVLSDSNDLIIGEEQLYRLDNSRFRGGAFQRWSYRHIYVCTGSISGFKPGWRVFQRPPTLPAFDSRSQRLTLQCGSLSSQH